MHAKNQRFQAFDLPATTPARDALQKPHIGDQEPLVGGPGGFLSL